MFIGKDGKKYFKGNLHMHTTRSDGVLDPEEALEKYREAGYDFVSVTDHWKFGKDFYYKDMLVLSGCECNLGTNIARDGIYHILAVGYDNIPEVSKSNSPQEVIDGIHKAGGLACLAHPAWSLNSPDEIAALKGIDFTEIFNSVSDLPRNARPYSGVILDILASRGNILKLAATDDTHFYIDYDTCRSYIIAEAEECTKSSIMGALKEGKYYSTQGPLIYTEFNDGRLTVDCPDTPVEEIVYYTDCAWNSHRADIGHGITHGEFIPNGIERFVRAEVKDCEGRYAWSQYIYINNC